MFKEVFMVQKLKNPNELYNLNFSKKIFNIFNHKNSKIHVALLVYFLISFNFSI